MKIFKIFFIVFFLQLITACSTTNVPIDQAEVNQTFYLKTDFYLVEMGSLLNRRIYAVNTDTNCCLPTNVPLPKLIKYYRNPIVWKTWHGGMVRYRIVGLLTQNTRCHVAAILQSEGRTMRMLQIDSGPFRGKKIYLIAHHHKRRF